MTTKKTIRVAAVQFGATTDVDENLRTTLRMIDEAAQYKPDLIVTPEFINHVAWYADQAHCYRVAVSLDGDFLKAIGAKAVAHRCYIKVNCTVRRAEPQVSGTNILFDPTGAQIAVNDKQILMGNENNFMSRATEVCPIPQTTLGRIGMYCCMDGVIPEPARGLAVRGAQLLLNSLNSFAYDEAALHIPVRAAENKVFVVAANKIGPLVPPQLLEPVAAQLKIAPHFLHGAGESQIVAPDGAVLARAPRTGEAVIFADIDVAQADDKKRPDGSDIIASRRPELYGALAQPPRGRQIPSGAARVEAAVYQPRTCGADAIEEVAEAVGGAARHGTQLFVLPELFHLAAGHVAEPAHAVAESERMVRVLQTALQRANANCHVVTSVVAQAHEGFQHVGVLIGRDGVQLRQPQLHQTGRHAAWLTSLGDTLQAIDLPWGRMAIITGGDAIYPEVFRLAVLQDVEVVAVPTRMLEAWEMQTGFLERSSENRMNIIVASQASAAGASAIIALNEDFTLWTQWKRPFDGSINAPLVTRAAHAPGLTRAAIFPAPAANRFVSQQTNVVEGRPWQLVEAMVKQ